MNLRLPLSRSPSASFIVIAALFQAVDANPQAIRTLDGIGKEPWGERERASYSL